MEKYQWSHPATKQLHQTIHVGCGRNDASFKIVVELSRKNGCGAGRRTLQQSQGLAQKKLFQLTVRDCN